MAWLAMQKLWQIRRQDCDRTQGAGGVAGGVAGGALKMSDSSTAGWVGVTAGSGVATAAGVGSGAT